ncbi:MAG: ABC transporter ATP-binding protein [Candidatus Aenigmarchaeota archaeon]|nr:ABC transporter ATP-binding protein [Candidatus Aenigmarchaeota archaeon]
MINISNLSFSYEEPPVIGSTSLRIKDGEFVGVAGPTGCGKTTFAMCLNGLIPNFVKGKFYGDVVINGHNTRDSRVFEIARTVGLVFQDPDSQLFAPMVEEEIAFGPKNMGLKGAELRNRIETAVNALGIHALKGRETHSLSQGEKKKVCIASILAMNPDILILDEPTAQLDYRGTREIYGILASLNNAGKTIMVIEHKTEWMAQHASRILLMDRGKFIADGVPIDVFRDMETLDRIGVEIPRLFLLKNRAMKEQELL